MEAQEAFGRAVKELENVNKMINFFLTQDYHNINCETVKRSYKYKTPGPPI